MSALRRFLVDFDAVPTGPLPVPSPPSWPPTAVRPLFGAESAAAGRTEDGAAATAVTAATAAAVAAGVSTALTQAEAVHAAALAVAVADALAEASARHAAALAAARERWAAEEGAALAAGFRAAAAALGDALGDAAAAALEPLLGEAARRAAVDGLRAAVADLLLAGTGGTVAVSGPVDLLDALRAALEGAGIGTGAVAFTAAEAAEVVVTADGSRIETRLAAWALALGRRTACDAAAGTTVGEEAA